MTIEMASCPFKASYSTTRTDALESLVAQMIADDGYQFDGLTWAVNPQEWWCARLDISPATLRRVIARPPFVRDCAMVGGRKMMLLRVGEKGSARDIARHLRNIWRKRTGKRETPKEFGCLVGLSTRWGEDAPRLFSTTLKDWNFFMTGVKLQEDWTVNRHYKHPSIALIRRFPNVAEEIYLTRLQEESA
ncbi:MAG: hypothetical protein ACM33T_15135 [Solirubrobacterales bacterium]